MRQASSGLVSRDDVAVALHRAVADAFHLAGLLPRPVGVSPPWHRSLNPGDV